jgi:hypothetical protein
MGSDIKGTIGVRISELSGIDCRCRRIFGVVVDQVHLRQVSCHTKELAEEFCLMVFITNGSTLTWIALVGSLIPGDEKRTDGRTVIIACSNHWKWKPAWSYG